jgi:hypothetical protein
MSYVLANTLVDRPKPAANEKTSQESGAMTRAIRGSIIG